MFAVSSSRLWVMPTLSVRAAVAAEPKETFETSSSDDLSLLYRIVPSTFSERRSRKLREPYDKPAP